MKLNRLLLLSLGVVLLMACRREGCTDQTAINYDDKAKNDDGSCMYDDGTPGGGGSGGTGPGGETLPIRLTGTETSNITIQDQSTNPNVADYYIDNTWSIDAAVTIEPGVKIDMRSGARIVVKSNGSLNATGTPTNKIVLSGSQDVAGYWYGIDFESNNPNNKLIHCNISNGSKYYNSQPATIVVENNAQVTIQNTHLRKGGDYGIMTDGGDAKLPDFMNNTISEFGAAPLLLSGLGHTRYLDNSTQFLNNAVQMIYINGSDVESALTVPKLSIPYSFRKNVFHNSGHTSVEAGTEFRMAANIRWMVGINASLSLDGTSSNPITVTGVQPSKGWWYHIQFESNNMNNNISYADISGGNKYYNSQPGMVYIKNAGRLSMDNTHLSNSLTSAIDAGTPSNFTNNNGNTYNDCDEGGGLLP
ncbi:hypothetical protein [Brumimicrobium sp.]|uniref:hypothetical protein n=1 Tax=Brumimicrobium sp. TaxID=2029867 RepID=UPI003A8DDC4F